MSPAFSKEHALPAELVAYYDQPRKERHSMIQHHRSTCLIRWIRMPASVTNGLGRPPCVCFFRARLVVLSRQLTEGVSRDLR